MKNYFIAAIVISITLTHFIFAQSGTVIYGTVKDAVTKQPLPGVNILVMDTDKGAATDVDGKYQITSLSPGTYRLRASSIGYNGVIKTDIQVSSSRPAQIDFELSEEVIQLEGITVTSGYFTQNPLELNSVRNFSYEEIRRAPGGFEDVIRALSVLPGVAQADAGRNDLVVRGGAPSENLYIIDGIEVPNINHFGTQGAAGGPLSYVNLDFVRETSFSTGGFPVLYGDKLSSVLTINLRNGRNDRLGGKATISASQFGLNLEGPFSSSSDFIFSARRSYLDFIFKAAGFSFVPEYYDVLSKMNYKIDNRNSISFLFISAFDNVRYFNDTPDKRYDNSRILGSNQVQYVTGLSYRYLFDRGFSDIILSRNHIDFDTSQRDSLLHPIFQNKSLEAENSLRADVIYKLSPKSELNIGASVRQVKFDADIFFPTFITTFGDSLPLTSLKTTRRFTKGAAYTNVNVHVFSRFIMNFGLRSDYFDGIKSKFTLSPRFSVSYKVNELTNLNFSTGIYHQTPSYIWLAADASNKKLKSVRTDQFIGGFDFRLRDDALLKVEAFFKDYKNYPASTVRPYLVLANTGAGFSGSDDNFSSFGLEPLQSTGKGNSFGVELSVQKKLSDIPFYGISSLTWSETKFTPLDGIKRIGSYDQTWIFNLSGGYKFDQKWEASLKFRYSTGRPYTPFNPDGTQSVISFNRDRLRANHSLDLRVDRRWFFDGWTLITYVDVQNVYNRKNQGFVRWDPKTQSVDSESSIGLLPSIGISVEF